MFGLEGDIELELEAHHLAEAGPADARHFELLDHHQVPVQAHAKAASLEAATVELARQLCPRVVGSIERKTLEVAARRDHPHGVATVLQLAGKADHDAFQPAHAHRFRGEQNPHRPRRL